MLPGSLFVNILEVGTVGRGNQGVIRRIGMIVRIVSESTGEMVVAHYRPFDTQLLKSRNQSFRKSELRGEEALGGLKLGSQEVVLLQGDILIDEILEEIIRSYQRSHGVMPGKVNGIQGVKAVGGLDTAYGFLPGLGPARLKIAWKGAPLGEILQVVDNRSRHGYVSLTLGMVAVIGPGGLSRPVIIGILLGGTHVVLLQVVMRHRLPRRQEILVASRGFGLEQQSSAVIGVADRASHSGRLVGGGVIVRPEIRHVIVVNMGGGNHGLGILRQGKTRQSHGKTDGNGQCPGMKSGRLVLHRCQLLG